MILSVVKRGVEKPHRVGEDFRGVPGEQAAALFCPSLPGSRSAAQVLYIARWTLIQFSCTF